MEWNRSNTIALAHTRCAGCGGLGLLALDSPCPCVYRAIFTACHSKFVALTHGERETHAVRLDWRGVSYGRKDEEYIADFVLLAKRALAEKPLLHRVFKLRYLLGADSGLIARKLNLAERAVRALTYSIRCEVGRAFVETKPYGIFPIDEYFSPRTRGEPVKTCNPPYRQDGPECVRLPLRPKIAA